MFVHNKYLKYYFNLIEKRRQNPVTDGIIESHHIIPKSMGGSNKKENLINLSAREHYIAHKLLVKITSDESKSKMIHALWGMCNRCINDPNYSYLSSKRYESARQLFVTIAGSHLRGKTYEEIHGKQKAEELKLSRAKSVSDNRKGKSWEEIFGPEKAIWMRSKVSAGAEKRKGRSLSKDVKLKISLSSSGKKYEKKLCVICNKMIGSNNFKKHQRNHSPEETPQK